MGVGIEETQCWKDLGKESGLKTCILQSSFARVGLSLKQAQVSRSKLWLAVEYEV